MNGWIGTVLRVDLATGDVKTEDLNRKWAEEYLGCRGLGVRYYVDEVTTGIDALSPENKLIFATGPMTGLVGTSTGRYEVVAKAR